jgi:hypothetical protein
VPAGDLLVEILEEADLRMATGVVAAVARDLDEVEVVEDRHRAGEVDGEDDARLQRSDQHRLAVGIVACDLRAELAYTCGDLVGVEVHLADPGVVEHGRGRATRRRRGRTAARAVRGRACRTA